LCEKCRVFRWQPVNGYPQRLFCRVPRASCPYPCSHTGETPVAPDCAFVFTARSDVEIIEFIDEVVEFAFFGRLFGCLLLFLGQCPIALSGGRALDIGPAE